MAQPTRDGTLMPPAVDVARVEVDDGGTYFRAFDRAGNVLGTEPRDFKAGQPKAYGPAGSDTPHRPTTNWKDPFTVQAASVTAAINGLPDTSIAIGHSNGGMVSRKARMQVRPFKGIATVGTAHNGVALAARVSDYNGPDQIDLATGETFTWNAEVYYGVAPFTYQWSGILSGTGSSVSGRPPSSGTLRLRVTASDGSISESELIVHVFDSGSCDTQMC